MVSANGGRTFQRHPRHPNAQVVCEAVDELLVRDDGWRNQPHAQRQEAPP